MSEAVLTESRGRVLLVTLNRPDAMNAIDSEVGLGLVAAMDRLDADEQLSVGVLTGAGRAFCAGMDLKAFAKHGVPEGIQDFFERGSRKPLVAAIEGFALAGGLEVALTCDLLVASESVRLGIPEVAVGLFAAGGALFRLPNRLPTAVAMEMALTGKPITARRAAELGLVNRVTEKGAALETAIELAQEIAVNAPLALAASKQVIRESSGLTEADAWVRQRDLVKLVFRSDDAKEGARAFAEKRAPEWSGS